MPGPYTATSPFTDNQGRSHASLQDYLDNQVLPKLTASAPVAAKRTAGNLADPAAVWTAFPSALDLVLPAAAGDWIEFCPNILANPALTDGEFDVASIVGGNPAYYFGSDSATIANGYGGWYAKLNVLPTICGSVVFQVASGDLESGNVRLRMYYRNTAVLANANYALRVWARKL